MAAFPSTTSAGRLLIKLTRGVLVEMTTNMSYRPESLIFIYFEVRKGVEGFKCGPLLIVNPSFVWMGASFIMEQGANRLWHAQNRVSASSIIYHLDMGYRTSNAPPIKTQYLKIM